MNKTLKLHLACGDVYLKDYINIDIIGEYVSDYMNRTKSKINPNETTIDNYFKFPWQQDRSKRKARPFIIDKKMNILKRWQFASNSVSEIVMINAIEHFNKNTEILYIINEAYRVLETNGIFKFDFPNIRRIVTKYYDKNPEFCMELIYCNHKNKYSIHKWGYTLKSIKNYFNPKLWQLKFKQVVKHDYPSTGCWAIKL